MARLLKLKDSVIQTWINNKEQLIEKSKYQIKYNLQKKEDEYNSEEGDWYDKLSNISINDGSTSNEVSQGEYVVIRELQRIIKGMGRFFEPFFRVKISFVFLSVFLSLYLLLLLLFHCILSQLSKKHGKFVAVPLLEVEYCLG